MKVMWVLDFLPPVFSGRLGLAPQASGSWAVSLLAALPKEGLDLVLCSFSPELSAPCRERIDGVSYLGLPAGDRPALETALAEEKGIETLFLAEDADVTFGESALRIYAPLGSGGANEEGLSVLCTAGDFDGLITGDMNDTVEKRLIKYGSLPDLELLVAGHHGSKYATSEELLLATTPELAVISVGYNTYGHPAPETLERLAAAGCAIYRTDWSGTVTITAK